MDQNSKKTESVREFLASLKPEADEVVRLNPGTEPRSLALQADSLPAEPPGKAW